LTCYKGYRDTV
nr:RecName: Full=Short neurotoxin N1; AltName: Full=Alpha-neurotoxin [Pseudonaja textilis]